MQMGLDSLYVMAYSTDLHSMFNSRAQGEKKLLCFCGR